VGTTACESMIAAGNVFLGLAEAPLVIRPYIKNLTPSELHSVMTSGFSTVAGGILVSYPLIGNVYKWLLRKRKQLAMYYDSVNDEI